MEVTAAKSRNKGAALSAIIREGANFLSESRFRRSSHFRLTPTEQERFVQRDPLLQDALNEHYDYMIKYLDLVLNPAIEQVLLYQPDQTADFLANAVRGTLDPKKYNYVVSGSVGCWVK